MKKCLPILLLALMASACTHRDSTWVQKVGDNNFTVEAAHGVNWRNVVVRNNDPTWNGALKGGAEKWEERKKVLRDMAETEIQRLCGGSGFTLDMEPQYVMVDREYKGASAFGPLGEVVAGGIAIANSEDANLPASGIFTYTCNNRAGNEAQK